MSIDKFQNLGYLIEGQIYDFHSIDKNKEIGDYKLIHRSSILGLNILRHTFAHILAQALQRIYKNVFFGIGPVTENGFYYDIHLDKNLSLKDLKIISEKMKEIIKENIIIQKTIWTYEEIKSKTSDFLKLNIIENLYEKDKDTTFSIYNQEDFWDICKGPHVYSTGMAGDAFQLTNVSQIVWRGYTLQRIEGIAFDNMDNLEEFKKNYEESKQNDHRILGPKLNLFSFSEFSPGCVFWHSKGRVLNELLTNKIKSFYKNKYEEIITPPILKKDLWLKTGHIPKYEENMFVFEDSAFKPMNCPAHALYFMTKLRSYRDLPLRIAEFGRCFRNEECGGLLGLKRCIHFTQDDGHIFCTMQQIISEIKNFIQVALKLYEELGFKRILIKLATKPINTTGDEDKWNMAEEYLKQGLEEYDYILAKGEGAFYGPKIELHLEDNMKRLWQCGTIQVDFFLAEKLSVYYMDESSNKQTPIVLHRATLGSMERFIAILLENHKGKLPLWLAPVQVSLIPINEHALNYINNLEKQLTENNIRYEIFSLDNSLSKNIKLSNELKIPMQVIMGNNEVESETFTVRKNNENLSYTIEDFIKIFNN